MPTLLDHLLRPRRSLLTLAVMAVSCFAYAQVTTQSRPDFQRISLDFKQPVRVQLQQGESSITLRFDKPLPDGGVGDIVGKLGSHVAGAERSADGRTLNIRLKKPYRVRQFVSGDVVGIDILNQLRPGTEPKEATKPEPKKPEPAAKPKPEVLTTKREVPPKPTVSPKPEPTPEPAAAPDILTTKKPEPTPEVTPEPAISVAKTPVAPATSPAPPVPDPNAEITPEEAAAETQLPKEDASKPFTVTTRQEKDATLINFPWGKRTAAAVFERARNIWIVFSHEADANTELLSTALPRRIVNVQQYKLPGATVLRLTTDGTVHASAKQKDGSYEWDVTLTNEIPKASLDVPVVGETQDDQRVLIVKAFDTSEPLTFYDPDLGDRLLVVPTYEGGRGVANRKTYPELDILQTQQGIAIVAQRDDANLKKLRGGLRLTGKTSLAVSDNLPIVGPDAAPVPGVSAAADVMLPYDQWFVKTADFAKERETRISAIATSTPAQLPASQLRMVELYLGQGLAAEALGYLQLIRAQHPEFYAQRKLALLAAASQVMQGHVYEASRDIAEPELNELPEALMWRELIAAMTPATVDLAHKVRTEGDAANQENAAELAVEGAPEQVGPLIPPPSAPPYFDFLKYNSSYIRYYPPRVRQKLAILSAEMYIENGREEEALKTYDTLNRDGILRPIQRYAEYTLAVVAAKKGKTSEALKMFDSLSNLYNDLYIQARARYAATMLRYTKGMADVDKTTHDLEALRVSWRGDTLQRDVLITLAQIYKDNKRYDDTLRSWKYLLDNFPNDPDTLALSTEMASLFEELFLRGLADDMPPLRSLALFYEFRELTPIGQRGDEIIQKLADRLAAVDLIDRATQLLEHQIKFRISGEERARVGARLGLLYLLNRQPTEALSVLEVTNYGEANPELRRQRTQLTAQALSNLGKHEEALSMLFNDNSAEADMLRLDILWAMKDWPNVVNQAEEVLSERANLTASLTPRETDVLLKLALGYSFEGDRTQLKYLRDYYSGLIADGQYKEIFDFLTNDTAPLDPEDFQLVAQQISRTESFLGNFRKEISAGNLSDTVK